MFTSQGARIPGLVKSLVLVSAMLLASITLFVAPAMASTESNPQPPGNEIDNALMEMCDRAVDTFFFEIDWILSHDSDHPRMDQHVDSMWAAWEFAEVICRIDVGGNGELG